LRVVRISNNCNKESFSELTPRRHNDSRPENSWSTEVSGYWRQFYEVESEPFEVVLPEGSAAFELNAVRGPQSAAKKLERPSSIIGWLNRAYPMKVAPRYTYT